MSPRFVCMAFLACAGCRSTPEAVEPALHPFLARFRDNPHATLQEQPERVPASGPVTSFSAEEIRTRSFLVRRDDCRLRLCMKGLDGELECLYQQKPGVALFDVMDRPERLVDLSADALVRGLEEMDKDGLRSGRSSDDSYTSGQHQCPAAPTEVRFVGQRCLAMDPREDEAGRVADPNCFELDAGAWHVALVNQVGKLRRSFFVDATYDPELWNHKVIAYAYSYFNPRTLAESAQLEAARIARTELPSDRFLRYRSPLSRQLVGVKMQLTLVAAGPDGRAHERRVTYFYDLELGESGRIVGGEWYTNSHPDFLWTFSAPGAKTEEASQMTSAR